MHIYNLYSILKTSEYDVLLVRHLHPVSLALLPSGHRFEPHLLYHLKTSEYDVLLVTHLHPVSLALLPSGHRFEPHLLYHFLTFCADLIKWPDRLMGWPVPDRCLTIYRRAAD
jgi:hypothetical protein